MHSESTRDLFAPVKADDLADTALVTIRPQADTVSKQGFATYIGVSGLTAGARAICMHRVVIAPGLAARAHRQDGHETVLYLLKGRLKTFYGEGLRKGVVNQAGDFLYIPANMPYKPVNLSTTEPAEAIVARTDPNGQDSMTPYPEPFAWYGAAERRES